MVLICLHIKAQLENVKSLTLPIGHIWTVTLQQSQGSERREGVEICENESHEIPGSKGDANFLMKWARDDRKHATINIEHVKKYTRAYAEADSGSFVPIIGFDCRGAEPVDWTPQGGFRIESTGGAVFDNVDLKEKEWCDYDEKAELSVGVYELEWKFEVKK
mmetsp:Transcript_21630/g.55494  ORF Transcript_21630/g.55494 Transcript_21630/m.55494 type:complete len:162 (+) Transcript_21630:182-667(+)|eukprot:jgi/Tetstr1/448628/TSEL_035873.t1